MKPLLAHIYEPHRVTYPCYVQPKLNGIRALYQNGCFQSRDGIPFPVGLLNHLAQPLLSTFASDVILDGELYVHGWPLQRINAAVTPVRQHPTEDTVQVEYHVFDVVDFGKTFEDRLLPLTEDSCQLCPSVFTVETNNVDHAYQADSFYAHFVSLGYEGMMYRLGDCPYTTPKMENINTQGRKVPYRGRFLSDKDNRCWHLLKRKDWQDNEFECISADEGEGKLKGTLGALVCRPKPDIGSKPIADSIEETKRCDARMFHVGSGLTDSQRHFYWRNPPIGKLIKVKYLCLSSDGIPLNPTIHPDHEVK